MTRRKLDAVSMPWWVVEQVWMQWHDHPEILREKLLEAADAHKDTYPPARVPSELEREIWGNPCKNT